MVESVPIVPIDRTFKIVGPRWAGTFITQQAPHRITEKIPGSTVQNSLTAFFRNEFAVHYSMKALSTYHTAFEGVHIEITNDHSTSMIDVLLNCI